MKFLVLLLFSLSSTLAFADAKEFYVQRTLHRTAGFKPKVQLTESEVRTFTQRIDHFSSVDNRTFEQRYFVDMNANAPEKTPVILYICGEATCNGSPGGALNTYATYLNAHIITLEHRYYGYSQPFANLSTQNLKYLTVENALEDLANFQREMMKNTKFKGPWIVAGGSYAGLMSAFYRLLHPELVVGALASSAPVQARVNFEEYDLAVSQGVTPECANQLRSVVAQVEAALDNPVSHDQIKKQFNAELIQDDDEVVGVVADMAALAIQYGFKDMICNEIRDPALAVAGYARVGTTLFNQFDIDALKMSSQGAESENYLDYIEGFAMRQWIYQTCTQFGYFQTAYHDPTISVRSARINTDLYNRICKRLFNTEPLDVTAFNSRYYQALLLAPVSNIVYTNGFDDPWARLSITPELGNNTNPATVSYTIPGGSHCQDLGSFDSAPGSIQMVTLEHFRDWVQAFGK